jgi:hypothetical protein
LGWLVSQLFGIPHVVSLRGADVPSSAPDETARLFRWARPVAQRIGRDAAAVRAVATTWRPWPEQTSPPSRTRSVLFTME